LEQVTAPPQAQVAPHMPAENLANVKPELNQNLYFSFHLIINSGFYDARYITLKFLLHTVYMWPTESAVERTKRMGSWVLGWLNSVFQAWARSLIPYMYNQVALKILILMLIVALIFTRLEKGWGGMDVGEGGGGGGEGIMKLPIPKR
jgi:hypothetical protein